jgi:MSHA biogenesis protein MshJ
VKAFWQQQARRIDALSLRERAILFVSMAMALVAATDALVLSPRLAEQKALLSEKRLKSAELDSLRTMVAAGGAGADTPAARLARQLIEARTRQQALDTDIARGLAAGQGGARLPDLLERVLRRYERLSLLRLATVAAPRARAQQAGALPLQGVEIAVRGSYPDLAQYVADTESALPALRWGELSISATGDLPVLTAHVYLLGAAP